MKRALFILSAFIIFTILFIVPLSASQIVKKEGFTKALTGDFDKDGIDESITLKRRDIEGRPYFVSLYLEVRSGGQTFRTDIEQVPSSVYNSASLDKIAASSQFIGASFPDGQNEDGWHLMLYEFNGYRIKKVKSIFSDVPSIEAKDSDGDGEEEIIKEDRDFMHDQFEDRIITTIKYDGKKWETTNVRETYKKKRYGNLRDDGAKLIFDPGAPRSAQRPIYSPNGNEILFTMYDKGYDAGTAGLYTVASAGGSEVKLFEDYKRIAINGPGPAWHHSSGRILFSSDRTDRTEVYTISVSGSNLRQMTTHTSGYHYRSPSFSPDGKWIAYESSTSAPEVDQKGGIWKIRTDGSYLTELLDPDVDSIDHRFPSWSPRGDRIMYQMRPSGSDDWNICQMDIRGINRWQITTGPWSDVHPSWSPNGRCVVYSSKEGGLDHPSIFIISAKGGDPVRVTHSEEYEDTLPCWSPDGRYIIFESRAVNDSNSRGMIYRIGAPYGWRELSI